MNKNSFITKTHFELSDNYIPYFRLTVILVFIGLTILNNSFIDTTQIGNKIFIILYLCYSLVLLVFTKLRKLLAFKYPFILVFIDMLLISYGITISGGPESPLYLFYILFISYFAIVSNLKLALICSVLSAVYYTVTILSINASLSFVIIVRVIFFIAFACFTGIINERLRKFNIKLATEDHLTLLYNRQYVSDELENVVINSAKSESNMTLIIFDVDNFKCINDQEGHLEGDRILTEIATIIKKTIRDGDIAARYGGDEFIIVLPNTDNSGAAVLCDRLKENIRDYFANKIDISLGFATYPFDGKNTNDLFRNADIAMYREKELKKKILKSIV